MWLSRLKTQHSVHEDVGSIPGLTELVKDAVLPQAVVWVADVVRLWCRLGCGVGWQLQLQVEP